MLKSPAGLRAVVRSSVWGTFSLIHVRHLSGGDEWQWDFKVCPSREVWAGYTYLGIDSM